MSVGSDRKPEELGLRSRKDDERVAQHAMQEINGQSPVYRPRVSELPREGGGFSTVAATQGNNWDVDQ